MRRSKSAAAFALSLCLASPSLVFAQSGQDSAAAESLFREAKALMEEGKYEEACPKLEASQRLDPGVGTLLNLADCNDKAGKTASAWAQFLEAATLARRSGSTQRAEVATERAKALEPRLIRLRLKVPEAVRVPGMTIKRDGVAVDEATWGSATPIDPGPHLISAVAPGKKEWTKALDATGEGSTLELEIPALEDAPAEAKPVDAPGPRAGTRLESSPRMVPVDGSAQRTAGIIVAGVGLVGMAAGGVFGLKARSNWNDAACEGGVCRSAASQELAEDARSAATLSTVFFIGGGVLSVIGVVVAATAPSGMEPAPATARRGSGRRIAVAPSVAPGGAGLALFGSF